MFRADERSLLVNFFSLDNTLLFLFGNSNSLDSKYLESFKSVVLVGDITIFTKSPHLTL